MSKNQKSSNPSYYAQTWEVLKEESLKMKLSGIPDHEFPPAVADWLVMSVLAMGMKNGVPEYAVLAIIVRQFNLLEDWREGRPPFDKFPGGGRH